MTPPVTQGRPGVGIVQHTSELDKLWSDASAKYIVDQAGQIREASSKWGQSAVAILAVAGLAAAFKGRETLDAIDPTAHLPVVIIVAAALVLSGLAILTAALATSGSTTWTWNDPTSFRNVQVAAASAAAGWLNASKWLVVLAFGASIVAVGAIAAAPDAPSKPAQTLVVAGGSVVCGELTVADGKLMVGGSPLPDGPVAAFNVGACPK